MKIRFRFRFLMLGLGFYVFLFLFVAIALGGVGFVRRGRERDLRVEHGSFDALGLIITPLIGRFDLAHHRLVGMLPGKQSRDGGEHGQDRGAQRHPGNPSLAAVLGAMMELFV